MTYLLLPSTDTDSNQFLQSEIELADLLLAMIYSRNNIGLSITFYDRMKLPLISLSRIWSRIGILTVSLTCSRTDALTSFYDLQWNWHAGLSLLEAIHRVWSLDDAIVVSSIIYRHKLEVEFPVVRGKRVPSDIGKDRGGRLCICTRNMTALVKKHT